MVRFVRWLAVLFLLGLVAAKFDPHTGFTALLRFGATWENRRHPALAALPIATVSDSSGYDGQFYSQLALDPTLRDPHLSDCLDAPSYRARRILLPATAWLCGLGHPAWILQAAALLNIVCWLALASLLHRDLPPTETAAFARWFGCLFSMGILESVRQSLVDLPALLLLYCAVRSFARSPHSPRPPIWLAASTLTKESNLLATLALAFQPPLSARRLTHLFLASLIPLLLWSLYVAHQFASSPQDASGLGNFTWPLVGAMGELQLAIRAMLNGDFDGRYTFALAAIIGFGLQVYVLCRHPQPAAPWWRIGLAYAFLLLFLGPWVWSGYWAVCRAVLPLTIAFNLLLPSGRSFWPLWIFGNLTTLHAVWRFL